MTLVLTVAGRSQHLSRLIQLKLQIISNIWSWNYTTEKGKNIEGRYKWLPFMMIMHIVEHRQQQDPQKKKDADFYPLSSHWEQLKFNCAFTHKRVLGIHSLESCEMLFQTCFSKPFALLISLSSFSLTVADCLFPPPDLTILPSTS